MPRHPSVSQRSRQPPNGAGFDPDPLLGTFAGPFALDAVIGVGGVGSVYRARGGPRGAAAVKVLHPELFGSDEIMAHLEREVEILRRVRHPGVVDILAVGRLDDGRPYLAMELLDGTDLDAHIAQHGRRTPAHGLEVLGQLCEALASTHGAGVVHGDVKASNVFLASDRRAVLLDVGIANLVDPTSGRARGATLSGQALGTPSRLSPEQLAGRPATPLSDVYGLGALFYHLLTGEPPFADASPGIRQQLHAHARRPRAAARVVVPDAVDDVIATAMALEPKRRHPGPREMLAACRAALALVVAACAGEFRPAMAVRVDVRLDAPAAQAPADDNDDLASALHDAEAVRTAARAHFSTRGFTPALEASESILFVRPLPPDSPSEPREEVAEFERLIASRSSPHPSVTVFVAARSGEAAFSGNTPVGGPLLDLDPRP